MIIVVHIIQFVVKKKGECKALTNENWTLINLKNKNGHIKRPINIKIIEKI